MAIRVGQAARCVRGRSETDGGFGLVEVLVATALVLIVMTASLTLVNPNVAAALAEPEATDMQQRARAASGMLFGDLLVAGAGLDAGPRTGALGHYFAPIVPRVMGVKNADPYTLARPDALTLVYVPNTPAETTTSAEMATTSPSLAVDQASNCVAGAPVCGLGAGVETVVFDAAGHFDIFNVTSVDGAVARLQHRGGPTSRAYPPGSYVAEAISRTYYFDATDHQLRAYDGYSTDQPVVDDVVGVDFEYFGDPNPPDRPKPPPGVANCLYDENGNRLDAMATLTPEGGSLAALPVAMFEDGPWCGDGDDRYDADLLRIRRVRVTLRVEASAPSLRASGPDYRVPGTSRSALRALPDYTVTFDASPRNLNLDR